MPRNFPDGNPRPGPYYCGEYRLCEQVRAERGPVFAASSPTIDHRHSGMQIHEGRVRKLVLIWGVRWRCIPQAPNLGVEGF